MDGDQLDIEDAVKAQSEGFLDGKVVLFKGDCLSVLASLPENSIDAVVCDPPYHLTSIVKRFGGKNAAPAKEGKTGAYARASAGFMGKCFHPATDIMTRAGWRPVADVVVGDVVATLNPDTREVEWLSVEQAHTYPFEGVLTHVRHRSAEQVVTPNHKVAVSFNGGSTLRLVEPGQLSGSFHLLGQASPISGEVGPVPIESVRVYGKNRSEHRVEREVFEPKAFFRFLGLWLGDGYAVSRAADHPANDFFGLNVKKTRKVEAIRAALEVLCINFTETDGQDGYTQFYCYNFALLGFLKGLGKAKGKHIPEWVFQRDAVELEELYRGLIDTDGTIQGDGQEVFFTSSPRLADDFQRLCFHTGRSAISIFKPGGKVVSIGGQQTVSGDAWSLSVLKPGKRLYCEESKRGRVLYEFPYTGLVHCIGVPRNHIVMSRFNGKPVWSGNSWDGGDIAFRVETWALVLRVLKPGGHLIAFSGTRTYHRMACAIEDAGFEVRDMIAWHYGSGFPKSHNVSKAMDARSKLGSARTEDMRRLSMGDDYVPSGRGRKNYDNGGGSQMNGAADYTPEGDAAKQWDGWGTALKPSHEPVCFAQKPLTNKQLFATIGSDAARLWSRLWLMLSAKDAVKYLGLNPNALGVETSAFAQWTAADASSTRAALSAQMGTSQFGSALISALSTVFSWNSTLVEASGHASTFITGTESSTTTELKILKSSLSRITPESIILAHKLGGWSTASASPAEKTFNAHVRKWQSTLELHALASVTEQFAEPCQVETATGSERVVLARKPLDGTVAENVLKWGTGALNIDACRVGTEDNLNGGAYVAVGGRDVSNSLHAGTGMNVAGKTTGKQFEQPIGRWPANLMHDGSPEVVAMFPDSDGQQASVGPQHGAKSSINVYGDYGPRDLTEPRGDGGSAARFFWSSKAAADDRLGSKHPTVKPIDLMQELVRLVCPKGGTVLDPFAGTGTTGEAAWREGMKAVLIEREAEYQADIARRMELAVQPTKRAAVAKTKNKIDDAEDLPLFVERGET